MNAWQAIQQVRYLLRAAEWSTGVDVFGTVEVTTAPELDVLRDLRLPAALLRLGPAEHDPELAAFVTQRLEILLLAQAEGDTFGAGALLGHGRDALTDHMGRGLLEVEEKALAVLGDLLPSNGIVVAGFATAEAEIAEINGRMIVGRPTTLEIRCTAERSYHPARDLVALASGGGAVALTWRWPPDRWDGYRLILRRASGTTAPATVTDGTAIGTYTSRASVSASDTPGAGTFSYALFAQYADMVAGTATSTAAACTATVTAT